MIIGTNFKLSSAKFLDDRQLCKDYATLIANTEGIIYPPGFEVFCEYENKYYQYVSDTNGGYTWEERKSGVSDGTVGASIKDDTISENYTWSSAHIDSMRIDLETLITQANDYVDEIDERMLFIEGKFQWFEYFDGSYESLTNKPTIPTKISELENDSEFLGIERLELELGNINEKIDAKIDKEEDRTLISVAELERLSAVDNYNDTEVRQLIDELETQAHTHINSDILNTITEEKINQWDNNTGVDDYNHIQNKPIIRVGDDSDILLNFGQIIDEGMYIITAMVGEYKIHNELVHVKWIDDDNVKLTIPNMFMVLDINRTNDVWTTVNELHYGIDRENGKISDTLTIGEDKIILDKEGNGWFGGKVSQEGIPTEDKDLVTKGYMDERFTNYATNERIDTIDKENARRDVIIEALVNGRRRTVETDGNDVDLMFSTEKDKVWIDKIEGETLVNVCDQEEPIAVTKSYTVEGTNHVPLQGEYDGKARPVVHGNTLVNHNIEYDRSLVAGKKVEREGTKILNLEGTVNSELAVKLEGHTAINLSTKKEDVLCKSFDSASGNEINLVAEENSVSDLVIQGNTMANLLDNKRFDGQHMRDMSYDEGTKTYSTTIDDYTFPAFVIMLNYPLDVNKTYTVIFKIKSSLDGKTFKYGLCENNGSMAWNVESSEYTLSNSYQTYIATLPKLGTDLSVLGFSFLWNLDSEFTGVVINIKDVMVFEGDLTQTPELIPTGYVEGLKSTFEDKLIPYSIYNGDNLTSITETQYQLPLTVKPNTQYTVTTTVNTTKYQYAVYSTDGLTEYLSYGTTAATQTFTCNTNNVLFKVRMNPSYEGDDYSFVLDEVKDKFLIVEGDWSDRLDLLTEEYFGKYRVDMSSHGKNLFDVQTSYSVPNKTCFIHAYPIKPQTSYTISLNYVIGNSFSIMLSNIDYRDSNNHDIVFSKVVGSSYQYGQELGTKDNNNIIFNSQNYKYLYVSSWVYNGTGLLVTNIQLEEGTQATSYEPYYGSSKTVYLNSPLLNGDELLTKDGKLYHYHKMGMVVLDGSENWATGYQNTNTSQFIVPSGNGKGNAIVYNDKFPFVISSSYELDIEMYHMNSTSLHVIGISKSKLSTTDVAGFKQWLSENPTTVVYELAEPWYEPIGAYGKVVLDGSSDEGWVDCGTNYKGFHIIASTSLLEQGVYCRKYSCDRFATPFSGTDVNQDAINAYNQLVCHGSEVYSNVIYISTELSYDDFLQDLSENPVTVIYELAEPQYVDEDTRFNIASTSTIEYQSNVPMANTQFLPYRNELPLLESSTQYRVKFDCDVEGLELMVSLGGTTQTITSKLHNDLSFITPSLQTDGKLTIDGYGIAKIDNVLITKGDMEYEYFEGLKSGFEDGYIPENALDISNISLPSTDNFKVTFENNILEYKSSESYTDVLHPANIMNFPGLIGGKVYTMVFNSNANCNITLFYNWNGDNDLGHQEAGASTLVNKGFNALKFNLWEGYKSCGLRILTNPDNCRDFIFSNFNILEGDWSHLTEEDLNNLSKYKATIKIKNPNAPIFGKGGRL